MTGFGPSTPLSASAAPDPTKHVRFTLGMVLGVDDFDQEFAYLDGRDRWTASELLGAGRVRGLVVDKRSGSAGQPEIVVTAGAALVPTGRVARVPLTQCASLNDWLSANRQAIALRFGAAPASVSAYVVLGHRATQADPVPIPGEPCRTEDAATACSRWQDDFTLELSLDAPLTIEAEARRALIQWLAAIQVIDVGGDTVDAILSRLLDAAGAPTAVAVLPAPTGLRIAADNVAALYRGAFELYTQKLRGMFVRDGDARRALDRWLASIPVVASGGANLATFRSALRAAAQKPPATPFLLPAPSSLTINTADVTAFTGEARTIYRNELRALWMTGGAVTPIASPAEDRLALARVSFPLTIAGDGTWQAPASLASITIEPAGPPSLVELDLVKEAFLAIVAAARRPYVTVAAGTVSVGDPGSPPEPKAYGDLRLEVNGSAGELVLSFPQSAGAPADPPGTQFVLKIVPFASSTVPLPVVAIADHPFSGSPRKARLRVINAAAPGTAPDLKSLKLAIEVSSYLELP